MIKTLEHSTAVAATRRRAVANFVWHFAEMCAAMCVAWMLVTMPFIAIARSFGTSDPVREWPEVATLIAVVAMSAGMAAEMRWRGHSRHCIAEMTAAMGLEAVAVVALAAAGLILRSEQFAWYHGLMPLVMIAAMLPRLDLYTAPVTSHHRTGTVPAWLGGRGPSRDGTAPGLARRQRRVS